MFLCRRCVDLIESLSVMVCGLLENNDYTSTDIDCHLSEKGSSYCIPLFVQLIETVYNMVRVRSDKYRFGIITIVPVRYVPQG